MSSSRRARLGTLLTAPGNTSQTPDGADGVDGAGRLRCGLDGQRDFGSRQERIVPIAHQYRAGVPAFTLDHDANAGRRGDRGDDADVVTVPFEQRTLLDVQLDECRVCLLAEAHGGRAVR